MIEKLRLWLLPILLTSAFLANQLGILDIGYVYIKSHDMKLTEFSMDWYPDGDDIFTAGESVTKGYNYEDGVISLLPDYDKMLANDLRAISDGRPNIKEISFSNLTYHTKNYQVKVCLDEKDFDYIDSTLFKKVVYLNIYGELELYDKEGELLLLRDSDKKFRIQDSITVKGIAPKELYDVKMNEIWIAQACDYVTDFVSDYERYGGSEFDYNYLRERIKMTLESSETVSAVDNLLVPDFPRPIRL